jgi:hypothetical protein
MIHTMLLNPTYAGQPCTVAAKAYRGGRRFIRRAAMMVCRGRLGGRCSPQLSGTSASRRYRYLGLAKAYLQYVSMVVVMDLISIGD